MVKPLTARQFYDERFADADMRKLAEPLHVALEDGERGLDHPGAESN
jgi:hypothetical protein